jgi:hypothetical protein
MILTSASTIYEVVLAIHIMAVVVAFGVTFAYPVMFAVAGKHDPRALATLHRIEYTVARTLINGGLVLVVAAGIFLATDGHHWSEFFVQWGLGAALVIGGLVGGLLIPASKQAEELAARDIAADAGHGDAAMSAEYIAVVRRITIVGTGLSLLVLLTILFMVLQP